MRTVILATALTLATATAASAGGKHHKKAHGNKADVRAVKTVIEKAYVRGVHIDRDGAAMRAGFHPDFVMFVRSDNKTLRSVTIEDWIKRMEAGKAKKPQTRAPNVRHKFLMVDVTGDVAVAKIAMHKDGVHIFTDYMTLYRFDEGWRIVGKVFQSHRRR